MRTAVSFLIFFLSGAAALMYEISWSRQIGLLFGHTIHAASIVLTSFFAGMALGYVIGARWLKRIQPIKGYGIAELLVAGWALVIPWLLQWSESSTVAAWLSQPSFMAQTAVRAGFSFVLLLPATIALGTTLPMMAQFLTNEWSTDGKGTIADSRLASRISLAYSVNTTGAIVGVVVASLVLLVNVGVVSTSFVAAAFSGFCGLVALLLSRHAVVDRAEQPEGWNGKGDNEARETPAEEQTGKQSSQTDERCQALQPLLVGLAAISGFGTLALEVLYLRMFSLVFHNSTYTFGAVLTVYLTALALGAAIASRLQRICDPGRLMIVTTIMGALAIPISIMIFTGYTQLDYFFWGKSFQAYLMAVLVFVGIVVLPPVTCLGVLLPVVWNVAGRAQSRSTELSSNRVGSIVGWLTAANTLAAAAGSVMASFVILPWLDLWPSFVLLSALFLLAAALMLKQLNSLARISTFKWLLLGSVLIVGCLLNGIIATGRTQSESAMRREELVKRWRSPYGWVDVVRAKSDGALKVSQNLHYRFGSTGVGVSAREYRQAQLPIVLHPQPRDVLFLGLGTGMTAAGAVPMEELNEIVIVELIPEVVDAARLLKESNFNVVDHDRSRVFVDDGRHYLLATEQKFDVIVADLFVPWESETGYLYTVEHYETSRAKLNEGGIFCQWLPLYQMGENEFELIADSFASVFEHTTIWWGSLSARSPVIALIGTEEPLEIKRSEFHRRLDRLAIRMEEFGVRDSMMASVSAVHKAYGGDWRVRRPDYLNLDEFPRVEFLTPISHRDRTLLSRSALERYFDRVLSELPGEHVRIIDDGAESDSPILTAEQIRLQQRFSMFGDNRP